MENLKNLEKIAKIFQPQNIITSDEIDQVLKGIMEILASYKKGTDAINEETKAVVNILLDKVLQSNKATLDKAETVLDDRMGELETLLKDVSQMCDDMEAMMANVKDGKDADEEKIVEDVVSRIKLEPTIVTLSAEEVRDRLSSLKDDARLDKSAIKGLDKVLQQSDLDYAIATLQQQTSFLINRGGVKSLTAGTNITITDNGGGDYTIASSGGGGTPGGSTTQLQYNNAGAFGGISGATTNGTAVTYTAGNLIAADVTASGSGGFLIQSNNGTDVGLFGAGGGSNASFYGGVNITGDLTVDTDVLDVDTTNNRIGILTAAPTHSLTLGSTGTGVALYNTADQTTNYERMLMSWSANTFAIQTAKGGTGTGRNVFIGTVTGGITIRETADTSGFYQFSRGNGAAGGVGLIVSGTYNPASGTSIPVSISPTINQSSTAGYTALLVNPTESTTGSGTKLLADFQVGGSSKASIDNAGLLRATGGIYSSATNSNSNLGVVSASAGSSTTQAELLFGGAGSIDLRILERGSTSITLSANRSYASHIIGQQSITIASSGTNAIAGQLVLRALNINSGAGTLTNAATLYVEGAATGSGTIGNNYSLWVDAGTSRFDGAVIFNENTITAVSNAATVPVTARQHDITNNSAAGLTITLTTTGAVDGQLQLIRIFDFSAAAQTLTFVNTENSDVSVPATTNGSTTLPRTVGFMYNTLTSKWRCISNV